MENASKYLVICLDNTGYEAALERCKLYQAIEDPSLETTDLLRVVDESGEDYCYPRHLFIDAQLASSVRRAVLAVI